MTALSIIITILTLALAAAAGILLKGRQGCAVRTCASILQSSVLMAVFLCVAIMAQNSIVYDNQKLNGKYLTEGIDLYYMSKAAALVIGIVFLAQAAVVAARRFGGRIKPSPVFAVSAAATAAGAALAFFAVGLSSLYYQYADMLLPVIPVAAWSILLTQAQALLDPDRLWRKIVLIALCFINLAAVLASDAAVLIMTNGVLKETEADALGAVLLTAALLALSAPAMIISVSAIRNSLLKRRNK